SLENAQLLLNDILSLVSHCRFHYENKIFNVAASIGLTGISPNQAFTLNELFVIADAACYQAKNSGGNRIQQYVPKEGELKIQSQQFEWLTHINFGLENKQFVLFMQRMQSLTGSPQHCEILIRMKGDGDTLYLPAAFLPVAERYKLMPKIDRWVVSETFTILASKGNHFPYICAINLSGQTLSDESFLDFVLDQLNVYGINPNQICFEITETAVISNLDRARHFIHALREIGCRFSLDDFGSGLSSFAYLKNLEVDFLKIDGMFVMGIVKNKIDRAMVESINNVGHVMGLHTIAEFAENDEIIKMLKEIGVDYAQGYGVAKPELFE
ncbi:MAG: GGDEF domain-containing phosphodiesterase, partial [Pseudomonadota bacterium]